MSRFTFSIRPTLLTVLSLLVIISTLTIGGYSLYSARKTSLKVAVTVQESMHRNIRQNLSSFLEKSINVNRLNAEYLQDNPGVEHNLDKLKKRFLQFAAAIDDVRAIAFGSANGDFIGAGRQSDNNFDYAVADKSQDNDYHVYLSNREGEATEKIKTIKDYLPQQRSWYKIARQAGMATWSPVYVWASQSNLGVSAVLPVNDNEDNPKGVLMSALSLGFISDSLKRQDKIYQEHIHIVDRSGMLIGTSSSEALFTNNDENGSMERIAAQKSSNRLIQQTADFLQKQYSDLSGIPQNVSHEITISDEQYLLSISPFSYGKGIDWLIILLTPRKAILAPVASSSQALVIFGFLILIGSLFLGLLITGFISQPLVQLNKQIANMSMAPGEWRQVNNHFHLYEVNQLTGSFNLLIKQLANSYKLLEQRVDKRTAELADTNKQLSLEKNRAEKALQAESNAVQKNLRFVDMISHEYRTPVSIISANIDILQLKAKVGTAEIDHNLTKMRRATDKLVEIIDIALDKDRMRDENLVARKDLIDFSCVVTEAIKEINDKYNEREIILKEESVGAPNLYADATLLKVMLHNLLDNALKYSPADSTVEVETKLSDQFISLTIRDFGCGIPLTERQQVFTKYYRSGNSANAPGGGVGLHLVKSIIEQHGGSIQITANNTDTSGTEVTVFLPIQAQ